MLLRLLDLIRQGGTHTVDDLAQTLETSPALIEAMLEDLSQRGYLQTVDSGCPGDCTSCPLGTGCAVGGVSQIWSLTEKGRK